MEQEEEADLAGSVALQGVLDGDKVLQRLGHLAALDGQVTRVQEVAHPVIVLIVCLDLCVYVYKYLHAQV